MIPRPPVSTGTDTVFPYAAPVRSGRRLPAAGPLWLDPVVRVGLVDLAALHPREREVGECADPVVGAAADDPAHVERGGQAGTELQRRIEVGARLIEPAEPEIDHRAAVEQDRKSTRLNSSH